MAQGLPDRSRGVKMQNHDATKYRMPWEKSAAEISGIREKY